MKYLFSLLGIGIIFFSCQSQSTTSSFISIDSVTDFSKYPSYKYFVDTTQEQTTYKKRFSYIDSIDVSQITYSSDGLKVTGLLVQPKKDGKYPCIIYNRGGNRDFGNNTIATALSRMGKIASQGYVVIASNYRGNKYSEGEEEFGGKDVNDVLNLIDLLAEIKKANAEKIGMFGWSRGGMMTYLALKQSEKIDVACVGGARSDLTIIDRPNMEKNVYAELIPNYYENKEEELKKRSAIFWVDQFPKDVPILMLHGNADWRVKSTNSLRLALEFEKHRIPYRLKIFEGGDHGISEFRTEYDKDVIDWFDKYLKNEAPLPNMEFHGR